MTLLDAVGDSGTEAFAMLWETLWALVLGFALSGAVQAFVSRTQMQRALGGHGPAALGRASFFGVMSSSCSYAASALAKTLFSRGADFTASIVFMVASTNLVVELGIVLWLLIGWQFALAEFVGGAIMVALLGLVLPRAIPDSWVREARESLEQTDQPSVPTQLPWRHRLRSRAGWADAATYTIGDLTMLRREIAIGFVVAGTLASQVPEGFWRSLFITGHGLASTLENVALGPLLAILSFVCSIGNVPLAATLWQGGSSFGGVVSFVFADLITLPLLSIYRKYYGTRITLRLLGVLWFVMSLGGLLTELLFRALSISAPRRPTLVAETGIRLDHTTFLNLAALAGFACIYLTYRRRTAWGGGNDSAKDPVCGMQVEIAHAPASVLLAGRRWYFCCDGCAGTFGANPDKYVVRAGDPPPAPEPELLQIGRRAPTGQP